MDEKINIKEMFNSIAKSYDKLNDIISFNLHSDIKKQAIGNLPLDYKIKILDVCTGTGDIAVYFARLLPCSSITGIDFSPEMLSIAKIKTENINNITFMEGDALNLPFKEGEFDISFISFGLRNLTDLEQGLKEMKRVTKTGGVVSSLDMGKMKGYMTPFYNLFLFKIVPILGLLFSAKFAAYKYLPHSTEKFPSQDRLVEIFEEIGLKNVKKHDFLLGAISQQIGEV